VIYIIAGHYRRQRLITPKGSHTRPTANRLREALFNICQHDIAGASFLDLFAGSGAMGFEALSRGAESVTFIDAHKEAIHCIESNAARLHVQEKSQILRGEAFAMLKRLEQNGKTFDIIYADPPYHTYVPRSTLFYSVQMIHWVDTHPLLNRGGVFFVEEDYNSQPQLDQLNTLKLKDSRRFGDSVLQQYVYS
jgi:16S rRNA (guanine966-N2)-methyltransferase